MFKINSGATLTLSGFKAVTVLSASALFFASSASAEIIYDGSLQVLGGAAPGLVPGIPNYFVPRDAGILTGTAETILLHSFSQFDLDTGESILFETGGSISDVITRVTGGDGSEIAGTIAADANFWIIDSRGIIFSDGAAVNIAGSFYASTSTGLAFNENVVEFRTNNFETTDNALLTITDLPDPANFILPNQQSPLQINGLLPTSAEVDLLYFNAGDFSLRNSGSGSLADLIIDEFGIELPNGGFIVSANNAFISDSYLSTATDGPVTAGGFLLDVENQVVINGSVLTANSLVGTTGDAGVILMEAESISINGSQLQAGTFGTGRTGIIWLVTPLSGEVIFDSQSTAFATIETGGNSINGGLNNLTGTPFHILILTGQMTLNGGSQLQTLVRDGANGSAGWIGVIAQDATLDNGSGVFSSVERGANPGSTAGAIGFTVDNLRLNNASGISTSILSDGQAGVIFIEATEDLLLQNGSNILSAVDEGVSATQNPNFAGSIEVRARRLGLDGALDNPSSIQTTNFGIGAGGDIDISADVIALNDTSFISAATRNGTAGDLNIISQFLSLSENSNIFTFAASGGNGGNMVFDVTDAIYASPSRDNNISSDAPEGAGGDITFNASLFLRNIATRPLSPNSNDISASGELRSGEIGFRSGVQDLNPVQEQVTLPTNLIDASRLIAQGCAAGNLTAAQEIGELVLTGRGGVPPALSEQVGDVGRGPGLVEAPSTEAIAPVEDIASDTTASSTSVAVVQDANAYVEAQGWAYSENGEVVLTASADTVRPRGTSWLVLGCDDVF